MAAGAEASSDAAAKPLDNATAIRPRSTDVPDRFRPTIMSLPFHESVGIQTSTLRNALDESAVSSARQNSGRSRNGAAAVAVWNVGLRGSNVLVGNRRVNLTVACATATPRSAEHEEPYATGGADCTWPDACTRLRSETMDAILSEQRGRAKTTPSSCARRPVRYHQLVHANESHRRPRRGPVNGIRVREGRTHRSERTLARDSARPHLQPANLTCR